MERFRSVIIASILGLLVISCSSDRSKDVQIQKAAEIHMQAVAKSDSIMEILIRQKKQVEKNLSTETVPANVQSYKAMLKSLDKSIKLLDDWNDDVVGVPGLEHEHDHDHGHEHDHGHDHSHDEDILDDMSDKEILELQQAYSEHLDKIEDKISEVITTIELYSQNAEETTEK